ncbi:hypothetical protein CNBA8100 [Cryptococcus deneoformans B-3501A]|uniref:Phosphatidate cytidylyltransferase n=1 Tax=Cryptococcus deneoformans (strain JEC21 / ATCC MYA-565) TaxID=214684 RepID=Q5KMZ7_CRYD1|nr:conserved hypothetical protein [Cryptococcus neoformans var. neoformans JEC21]XP_777690.1 hypothetical protein CNBA8100 [Cryptococcus neoformans var. neoformans B-3501A]AAW41406.2 conserved hypothetical protein [Cryptococcus neoformans var. neoformans JEC21]EAL23043.1 hypothetical protein CNBA8100 [Cryptococcus neoformans var. neoformans B-3501A]
MAPVKVNALPSIVAENGVGLRDWDGSASGNENGSTETGTTSARLRKNPPRGTRPSLGVNGDRPLSHLDTIPSRPPSPPYDSIAPSSAHVGSPTSTQTQNQSYPPPAASTQTGTGSRPVVTRKRRSSSIKRKPSPGKVPEKVVDWEIPRKTFHSSIGFLTLYLNHLTPPSLSPLLVVLSTLLVFVLVTDLPRLWFPASRYAELWEACVGFLMRESEREKVNGVVWYLIGVIFVLGLYPRDVGVVAILLLSWADTTASTLGRLWGRYTPPLPSHVPGIRFLPFAPRKSLAGFLAAAVTGVLITVGFWGGSGAAEKTVGYGGGEWKVLTEGVWGSKGIGMGLTAGVVGVGGAVVEALDLGLDDNVTLPILSGAIIWAWFGFTNWLLP